MTSDGLNEADVRRALETCQSLGAEAPTLLTQLDQLPGMDDIELRQTFRRAANQLPSVEQDLRRHLARLSPGDPDGIVDLDSLAERLDEREAKQEIGVPTYDDAPARLTLQTSPGNLGAAAFMGLFGLGWNAFTLFHATLMITAMYRAFGIGAFALLLFYAIFFTVGFGMLWAAYRMACREDIELEGDELTLRRSLGPVRKTKTYTVKTEVPAVVGNASTGWSGQSTRRHAKPNPVVILTDQSGRPIELGIGATEPLRQETVRKINDYLAAHR